jgi:hypothetical protein
LPRFRKISHGLLLRERKSRSSRKEERPAGIGSLSRDTFRYFSHIAGYEGIFITGAALF